MAVVATGNYCVIAEICNMTCCKYIKEYIKTIVRTPFGVAS